MGRGHFPQIDSRTNWPLGKCYLQKQNTSIRLGLGADNYFIFKNVYLADAPWSGPPRIIDEENEGNNYLLCNQSIYIIYKIGALKVFVQDVQNYVS